MKWFFGPVFVSFFAAVTALGSTLEIPENCLQVKKSPCLVKAQGADEAIEVAGLQVRLLKDTLIQWDSFESNFAFSLLKGSVEIRNKGGSFSLNKIPMNQGHLLVAKKDQLLNSLDLKSFMLSSFILAQVQSNSVLAKSVFVEKPELFQFIAPFFQTKSSLKNFITEIEPLWKQEFKSQTISQTKVLKRAIASIEDREQKTREVNIKSQRELKKVRDDFFYRTFYR